MKYGVHFCPFTRECRLAGAPARVHLRGPVRNIGIALSRNARFVTRDGNPGWIRIMRHPDDNTGIDPAPVD